MTLQSCSLIWRRLVFTALVAIAGCSTLQYRTVQSQFDSTVRADNERMTMPFTDVAGQYQAIATQLTPAYIGRLDERLRPNAWTLRAVAQWRGGDFGPAVSSALEGLAEIARQSTNAPHLEQGRDGIILTMLPGLVEDSRLRHRFTERGAADVADHYDDYAAKFRTALRALAEAREKVGLPTPPEIVPYWNYQTWRVLENWLFITGQLPIDARGQANRDAGAFVQTTLANAGVESSTNLLTVITALEQGIPDEHPYRLLIRLEKLR